jgi:hypothetical protein
MRLLNNVAGVVIFTLTVTPGLAAAQATQARAQSVGRGLPLEQYTASLGIATPAGELRSATPNWSWRTRTPETRDGESHAAPTPTRGPSSAAAVQCPMPIVRPDTTVRRSLTIMMVPSRDGDTASVIGSPAGVIRGCENPLGSAR